MAADLVATNSMMDHIGRYLPSVRMNGAAFSFVVDLIINYGSPVLHLVMVRRAGQFLHGARGVVAMFTYHRVHVAWGSRMALHYGMLRKGAVGRVASMT